MSRYLTMIQSKQTRMTRQKQVILHELKKLYTHPTADDLYNIVRRKLPRISLGTVYRNLELMAEAGTILKLDLGGEQRRYDGNPENHYHIRCTSCGKVDDLPFKPSASIKQLMRKIRGYKVSGYRLEFIGLCSKCAKKHRAS